MPETSLHWMERARSARLVAAQACRLQPRPTRSVLLATTICSGREDARAAAEAGKALAGGVAPRGPLHVATSCGHTADGNHLRWHPGQRACNSGRSQLHTLQTAWELLALMHSSTVLYMSTSRSCRWFQNGEARAALVGGNTKACRCGPAPAADVPQVEQKNLSPRVPLPAATMPGWALGAAVLSPYQAPPVAKPAAAPAHPDVGQRVKGLCSSHIVHKDDALGAPVVSCNKTDSGQVGTEQLCCRAGPRSTPACVGRLPRLAPLPAPPIQSHSWSAFGSAPAPPCPIL